MGIPLPGSTGRAAGRAQTGDRDAVLPRLPEAVDTTVLRTLLDGRWAEVRDFARREDWFNPARMGYGEDLDTYRAKVTSNLRSVAASGVSALGFPSEYGGTNDIGGQAVSFEMLGFGDLSLMVKSGVQWGLFGGAVQALGTHYHHERYLRQIIGFALPGCFAMTEVGHGSNVQLLRTVATYEPVSREFVVHTPDEQATKTYICNAARDARMAVVFAQLDIAGTRHGVHAFLVPIRDAQNRPLPGVRIEDCGLMGGLNGVDHGRLTFNRVRVPREALLNRFGDVSPNGHYSSSIPSPARRLFSMLGTLVRGRLCIAGAAGSAAKTALTIAIRYAGRRRQFGHRDSTEESLLLDYIVHQRRLLPALATTYALHFAQDDLVAELHATQLDPDTISQERHHRLAHRTAGIKAVGTWHTSQTVQECREACGGAGYQASGRLPRLKADTDVFTTFEGDNTVLLQLVARGLLDGIDRQPPPEHYAGRVDPVDSQWQRYAFAAREERLLRSLRRRLAHARTEGLDETDAFNAVQDHALTAARASIEHRILAAFQGALPRCPDAGVAALLDQVCRLYGLSVIERERAWFLEQGKLTLEQGKRVVPAINALCTALRPHADTLIDGFGIPDGWLTNPTSR